MIHCAPIREHFPCELSGRKQSLLHFAGKGSRCDHSELSGPGYPVRLTLVDIDSVVAGSVDEVHIGRGIERKLSEGHANVTIFAHQQL